MASRRRPGTRRSPRKKSAAVKRLANDVDVVSKVGPALARRTRLRAGLSTARAEPVTAADDGRLRIRRRSVLADRRASPVGVRQRPARRSRRARACSSAAALGRTGSSRAAMRERVLLERPERQRASAMAVTPIAAAGTSRWISRLGDSWYVRSSSPARRAEEPLELRRCRRSSRSASRAVEGRPAPRRGTYGAAELSPRSARTRRRRCARRSRSCSRRPPSRRRRAPRSARSRGRSVGSSTS